MTCWALRMGIALAIRGEKTDVRSRVRRRRARAPYVIEAALLRRMRMRMCIRWAVSKSGRVAETRLALTHLPALRKVRCASSVCRASNDDVAVCCKNKRERMARSCHHRLRQRLLSWRVWRARRL